MKVNGITARFKQSLNLGDYNSVAVEISLYGDLEADETEDEAIDSALVFIKAKVREHLASALPVKTVETIVSPKFAGKVVQQ